MRRAYFTCLIGIAAMLCLAACAPRNALLGDPQEPYPPKTKPQVGQILHLRTGRFVSQGEMLAAATDNQIIYAAETHDNPASHRLELELLQALARRYPGRTAVAMEMFTPAQQHVLDAWVAKKADEKSLLKSWYSSWNMDFAYYREILSYCRAHGIPVRAVASKDFADLSAEEKALLPATLDLNDPYQRALTDAVYGGHAKGKSLAGFHRVQTLWDETMAQNIVRYLASRKKNDIHLLVMAGGNHIRNGFGIPRRVFRSRTF